MLSTSTEAPGRGAKAPTLRADSRASAEIDAAFASTGKGVDGLARQLRFLELIAEADPVELRRMFLSGKSTRQEKRSLAQRWAETDPASLCDFLKGLSRTEWDRDAGQHSMVRDILFRTWARQDADAALAAAAAPSNRPQFKSAQWAIAATLFGKDPAKGFALAAKLGNNYDRNQDRLLESVWTENPAAFLKIAAEGPVRAWRNSHVHGAVEEAFALLVKKDSPAAVAWLKACSVEQQKVLMGPMAFRFAQVDPLAAAAWFKDMPPSAEREIAGAEIVKAWAKKDPPAALEWLQDNLQGGRTRAFAFLADGMAEKGIESAKQLLEAMPSGAQRDAVVSVIAEKWAAKDFKPAMAWVLSLPADDRGRHNAMQQMGHQWADKDLPAASAYVRENPDSPGGSSMLWTVCRKFAGKDIDGGLSWAATLPAGTKELACMHFFQEAVYQKKLPEVFAAVEKMPASQQETMTGKLAEVVLRTTIGDVEQDAKFVDSLQHVPASLREVARSAIQQSTSGSPERKEAALKALK